MIKKLVLPLFAFFFLFSFPAFAQCEVSIGMVLADSSGVGRENFRKPPVIQNHLEHIIFVDVVNCPSIAGKEGYINFGDSREWSRCTGRPPGWGAPSCFVNHTWDIERKSGKKEIKITYKNGDIRYPMVVPVYNVEFVEKRLNQKRTKFVISERGFRGYSISNSSPHSLFKMYFNKRSIWEKFKNSNARVVVNGKPYPIRFCGIWAGKKYCLFETYYNIPTPAIWSRAGKLVVYLKNVPEILPGEEFSMKLGVYKFLKPY